MTKILLRDSRGRFASKPARTPKPKTEAPKALIGWKKCYQAELSSALLPSELGATLKHNPANKVLVKLEIPADAKRIIRGSAASPYSSDRNKCRASKAKVLEVKYCPGLTQSGMLVGIAQHDCKTVYAPGLTVVAPNWDSRQYEVCAGGIHFFLNEQAAAAY
jgi:hypothetical protein